MIRLHHTVLSILLLGGVLAGCTMQGQPPAVPPAATEEPRPGSLPAAETPPGVEESVPVEATEAPEEPAMGGGEPAAALGQGEIVFTRGGQLWAIGTNGVNERAITSLPEGVSIRDIAASPDGRYIAFILNAQQLMIIDTSSGVTTSEAAIDSTLAAPLVWAPDAATLYFQKLVVDPETSVPVLSQIWRAPMPPGGESSMVTEAEFTAEGGISPVAGLIGSNLVVQVGSGTLSEYFIFDSSSGNLTPLSEGYAPWDISPDGGKALLFNRDSVFSSAPGSAVALYIADIDPLSGAANIIGISPEGDGAVYQSARFAPDGERIVALRTRFSDGVPRTDTVLFTPNVAGGYDMLPLAAEAGRNDVAFNWHGDAGILVQRIGGAESPPEIWLLPLDGTAGELITTGDQPLSVGGF